MHDAVVKGGGGGGGGEVKLKKNVREVKPLPIRPTLGNGDEPRREGCGRNEQVPMISQAVDILRRSESILCFTRSHAESGIGDCKPFERCIV